MTSLNQTIISAMLHNSKPLIEVLADMNPSFGIICKAAKTPEPQVNDEYFKDCDLLSRPSSGLKM